MSAVPDITPAGAADAAAGCEVTTVDAVLAGRARSAGEFLAGVLAAAELDTAGTARKLPADTWPSVDPEVVQEIWNRACVVTWRAAQFAGSGWLYRDRLEAVQAQLEEAAYVVMGSLVGRSRRLVAPELTHPADGEQGRDRPTVV